MVHAISRRITHVTSTNVTYVLRLSLCGVIEGTPVNKFGNLEVFIGVVTNILDGEVKVVDEVATIIRLVVE
jgi:hypothetical protein